MTSTLELFGYSLKSRSIIRKFGDKLRDLAVLLYLTGSFSASKNIIFFVFKKNKILI